MGFFVRPTALAQGSNLEEVDSEEASDLSVTEAKDFHSKFSFIEIFCILSFIALIQNISFP